MGGSSSKANISSAQSRSSIATASTINTLDDDGVSENKKNKKDKKKTKTKDKVKTKDKDEKKKTKKKNKHHDGCDKNHKKISFDEKIISGLGKGDVACSSPKRHRKKSSCPSCEARDMLMDHVRARSGSLRYSDFNRIVRQSRIPELDETSPEISLEGVSDPEVDTVCFICGVYTGSVTRTCRVCFHVYHNGCLQKIGRAMGKQDLQLAQMEIWSCHQCSDISLLLTREETLYVSTCLEELGINPDNVSEENYIHYKKKMCEALGGKVTREKSSAWTCRFRAAVGDGQDRDENVAHLDWSNFLQTETISVLGNRCKNSLVNLMTESEYALARKMYKGMDASNNVTLSHVKNSIIELYYKFNIQWFQDEGDMTCLQPEDMERYISWSEFLRLIAIHMVSVRENNRTSSSYTNKADHRNNLAMAPSLDSVDDEDYRTCDSDLESPVASSSKDNTANKINLSDVHTLNDSNSFDDANKSLSILDDLSRAFNLDGRTPTTLYDETFSGNSDPKDKEAIKDSNESEIATDDNTKRQHLWQNPPNIRENPNFTTSMDVPDMRPPIVERTVVKRQSEVLVRPSTEEGRSPRRALSQKLVAPAYGLVDKIQSQEWAC